MEPYVLCGLAMPLGAHLYSSAGRKKVGEARVHLHRQQIR